MFETHEPLSGSEVMIRYSAPLENRYFPFMSCAAVKPNIYF